MFAAAGSDQTAFEQLMAALKQIPFILTHKDIAPLIAASSLLTALLIAVLYLTRTGVIARATVKEATRQPVFWMAMLAALFLLALNTVWPFFMFGEDVKMTKECGLATILFCGLLLAIWTSSTSVADEIEGKTAMTLLSKPINRRQFIVGKYLGVLTSALMLMVPLALIFLVMVFYKVGYDARESSTTVTPIDARNEVILIIPAIMLMFMEISVLSSISVAISTRTPMVVNMVSCFAIFIVGRLTPNLVSVSVQNLEPVQFMARLIAAVLPALSSFTVEGSISNGTQVNLDYLAYAALYSVCYCAFAVLLSFILFEDRDLA